MIAAAVLVTIASAVTGLLVTTLLGSYLFDRTDAHLRSFGSPSGPAGSPHGPRAKQPQLPSLFLVEEVSADGHVQLRGGSVHGVPPPGLSATQLHGPEAPFTAAAAGDPGHFWRVLVMPSAMAGMW